MNEPRPDKYESANRAERLRRIQHQLEIEPTALGPNGPEVHSLQADAQMLAEQREAAEVAAVLVRPEIWRELKLIGDTFITAKSRKLHKDHAFVMAGPRFLLRDDGTLWRCTEDPEHVYPLTVGEQISPGVLDIAETMSLYGGLHNELYAADSKIERRGGELKPIRASRKSAPLKEAAKNSLQRLARIKAAMECAQELAAAEETVLAEGRAQAHNLIMLLASEGFFELLDPIEIGLIRFIRFRGKLRALATNGSADHQFAISSKGRLFSYEEKAYEGTEYVEFWTEITPLSVEALPAGDLERLFVSLDASLASIEKKTLGQSLRTIDRTLRFIGK